jgi:hypothetical protein
MFIGGPEFLFSFLLPVALLGILALVAGVALRAGAPDRRGRRPLAVYLLVVMLVTLFTAVFSVFQAASTVVRAAVDPEPHRLVTYGSGWAEVEAGAVAEPPSPPGEPSVVPPEEEGLVTEEPPPEAVLQAFPPERPAAEVLEGLITAALAGAVFAFHLGRLRRLIGTEAAGG